MLRFPTTAFVPAALCSLPNPSPSGSSVVAAEVRHFLDAWQFHKLDGLELRQGEPTWLNDKTYVDPMRAEPMRD